MWGFACSPRVHMNFLQIVWLSLTPKNMHVDGLATLNQPQDEWMNVNECANTP